MANLGNLFFTLGLKTEDTSKELKNVIKQIDDFKKKITESAKEIKKVTDEMKKVKDVYDKMGNKQIVSQKAIDNIRSATDAVRDLQNAINGVSNVNPVNPSGGTSGTGAPAVNQEDIDRTRQYNNLLGTQENKWNNILSIVKRYATMLVGGNILNSLIRITGEFEYQRVALQNIIQDTAKANEIFADLKSLALESPFKMTELVTFTKQLSAFSIPKDELYDTVKMLGDISTGLGVSMDRLILAYGQIRSAAFLRGQEVRQLTEAGLPILNELADKFSEIEGRAVSAGEVFDKISRREVSFGMVEDVFKGLTEEGGKFYDMQQKQTETLKGQVLKLKDTWELTLASIGNTNSGLLKGSISLLNNILGHATQIGTAVLGISSGMVTAKLAMSIWLNFFSQTATAADKAGTLIGSMVKKVKGLASFVTTNPSIALLAAVTAVTTAIVAATAEARRFNKEIGEIENQHFTSYNEYVETLDILKEKLENVTEGSDAYHQVVDELNELYDQYLPNLQRESTEIETLTKNYGALTAAIRQSEKAKAVNEINAKFSEQMKYKSGVSDVHIRHFAGDGFDKNNIGDLYQQLLDRAMGEIGMSIDELAKSIRRGSDEVRLKLADILTDFFGEFSDTDERMRFVEDFMNYVTTVQRVYNQRNKALEAVDITFGGYRSIDQVKDIEAVTAAYERERKEIENMVNAGNKEELYRQAEIKYYKDLKDVARQYGDTMRESDADAQLRKLTTVESQFASVVKKYNEVLGLSYDETLRSTYEWIKQWVDTYDEIDRQIKLDELLTNKENKRNLEARKANYNKMFMELGLGEGAKYYKAIFDSDGKETDKETESQKRLYDELKRRFELVKMLRTAYEDLSEVTDSYGISNIFDAVNVKAGSLIDDNTMALIKEGKFEDAFMALADAARQIKSEKGDALAKDMVSENGENELAAIVENAKEAAKAVQTLNDTYAEFIDDQLQYEPGIAGKIHTVLNALKKDVNDAKMDFDKNTELNLKIKIADGNEAEFEKRAAQIAKMFEQSVQKARIKAQSSITDLASSIFNDYKGSEGIVNLIKNQSSLTYAEYTKLAKSLLGAGDAVGSMIEKNAALMESLKSAGINVDALIVEVNKLAEAESENVDNSKLKKLFGNIESAANAASDAVEDLAESLEDAGNTRIANALKYVNECLNAVITSTSAAGKVVAGDYIGAITEGVTYVTSLITKYIDKSSEYRAAIKNIAKEVDELRLTHAEDGYDGLFGDDAVGRLAYYYQTIRDMAKEINTVRDAGKSYADILRQLTIGKGKRKIRIADYIDWDLPISEQLEKILAEDGIEMDSEAKEFLETMKDYYSRLEDATDSLSEYMKDKFSDVGDTLADSLMSAFLNGEDYAQSFEDVMHDVSQSIVKDLLKSTYLTPVLKSAQERIDNLQQNEGMTSEEYLTASMQILSDALNELQAQESNIEEYLESFSEYIGEGEESGSGTSSAIQGITEETADILASYINAMRADVATQRDVLVGTMTPSVETISSNINLGLSELRAINENTLRSANNSDVVRGILSLAQGSDGAIKVNVIN